MGENNKIEIVIQRGEEVVGRIENVMEGIINIQGRLRLICEDGNGEEKVETFNEIDKYEILFIKEE